MSGFGVFEVLILLMFILLLFGRRHPRGVRCLGRGLDEFRAEAGGA